MDKFWMCMVDGGEMPNKRHAKEADARKEAERLAKMTGKAVILLSADAFVVVVDCVWKETQDIPPQMFS
jgi:hypothetical protein